MPLGRRGPSRGGSVSDAELHWIAGAVVSRHRFALTIESVINGGGKPIELPQINGAAVLSPSRSITVAELFFQTAARPSFEVGHDFFRRRLSTHDGMDVVGSDVD